LCGSGPSPRSGDVPADDVLLADIAGAFGPPLWSVPNGAEPWAQYVGGLIPGIGADAFFLWTEDSVSPEACGDHYVIFRTVDPVGSGGLRFVRGDSNGDRTLNLPDPVYLLNWLFAAGPPLPCEDAGDSDDSGDLALTDAVIALNYLFLGGPAPAAPGPRDCGLDPTPGALGCGSSICP